MEGRGTLTEEVKLKSNELFGYEISQKELRLMPYVFDRVLNNGRVEFLRIDDEEIKILKDWESKGFVSLCLDPTPDGYARMDCRRVKVTDRFYRAMSEILMISYGYATGMVVKEGK